MEFPILYKKTSTGAIQYWKIWTSHDTNDPQDVAGDKVGLILTEYGQLNTSSPQRTQDIIKKGKNIGKANGTDAWQQADAEALAKHQKQLKKGYVDSMEAAEAGEVDEIIEGGVSPMLAFTFEKQGHKIKYPCYVQRKYDGSRMIAVVKDGKCTLWSRTQKPIFSLPHIVEEIEKNFKEDIILDGEAYNHKFKENFEHIMHLVRQQEPDPECTDVEYHIYDMVNDQPFEERNLLLGNLFARMNCQYLVPVETLKINSEDEVPDWYTTFKNQGYEGCMLRNSAGLYKNKRSADLIKVKEMQDAEFKIISIEEGRGKLAGHVGAFVCETEDGQQFNVKMSGATEKLKEYFEDYSLWQDKLLTVQFQDFTSYGIPRFPVGLRLREMEE